MLKSPEWYELNDTTPDAYAGLFEHDPVVKIPSIDQLARYTIIYKDDRPAAVGVDREEILSWGVHHLPCDTEELVLSPSGDFIIQFEWDCMTRSELISIRHEQQRILYDKLNEDLRAHFLTKETDKWHPKIMQIITRCSGTTLTTRGVMAMYENMVDILKEMSPNG